MFKARPERRVVITGCGLSCAAGSDLDALWSALCDGSGHALRAHEPELQVPPPADTHELDRCAALASEAASRALADAGLSQGRLKELRAGVVLGTALGTQRQVGALEAQRATSAGLPALADFFEQTEDHALAATLAHELGVQGPILLNARVCSSGNAALAWAYELIASATTDVMIAGGCHALDQLPDSDFTSAAGPTRGRPRRPRVPREGVSFGEGAGVLLVEELEHARARRARIRAELAGYGLSNERQRGAPEPEAEGFARAVQQALATTGTTPEQVDHLYAHGSGPLHDAADELASVRRVFGERARTLPISTLEPLLGRTHGATSALEAIACVLRLEHKARSPSADRVGRAACLNLAAGFGGFQVCTVLKEPP